MGVLATRSEDRIHMVKQRINFHGYPNLNTCDLAQAHPTINQVIVKLANKAKLDHFALLTLLELEINPV